MPDEPLDDEPVLGRRAIDRYPGPEAMAVLLVELSRDITEIKGDIKEGFTGVRSDLAGQEKRLSALERFRERMEERDRALARAEGRGRDTLTMRIPALALLLTFLALVIGVVTTILSNAA